MRIALALSLSCFAAAFASVAAYAEQTSETGMLANEIAAKVPADWQIHISWRDNQLVAFVTPPYQQAFNLWYDPEKLRTTMLNLCPAKDDAVWAHLGQDKQIAVEPTVGGKSDVAMRLTCPHGAKPAI
jgi:hypothetical protein